MDTRSDSLCPMATVRIPWTRGSWSRQPLNVTTTDQSLAVVAEEGSDYWEKTLYGFQHDNGHALLAPWEDTEAVEVTFRADCLTELYDQAGLMLWHSPTQWIKTGIEINDGIPHLGAVVTDGFSDWSLSPVPEWGSSVITLRASRNADAVIIRARADDQPWRTIRVARFAHESDKQAGPFVCAPTRAGLEVTFTRWMTTAPDSELHADPPLDS